MAVDCRKSVCAGCRGPGSGGQRVDDAAHGGVVVRGPDEPALERRRRQVHPGVSREWKNRPYAAVSCALASS